MFGSGSVCSSRNLLSLLVTLYFWSHAFAFIWPFAIESACFSLKELAATRIWLAVCAADWASATVTLDGSLCSWLAVISADCEDFHEGSGAFEADCSVCAYAGSATTAGELEEFSLLNRDCNSDKPLLVVEDRLCSDVHGFASVLDALPMPSAGTLTPAFPSLSTAELLMYEGARFVVVVVVLS